MKKLLVLSCLLLACGLGTAAELPMRLGDAARPLAYRLALRVDPDQPAFSGQVTIDLRLLQATQKLRLHASAALKIQSATLQRAGKAQRVRVSPADADTVWLHFAARQAAGTAQLTLKFGGRISETEVAGLFRQREGGDWYAITQLAEMDARRVFPLFDEPGWKVPWRLSLTVPSHQQAFANAPVLREAPAGPGWKRIEFKATPPLSSYLVAFAVGPFDVLDGGRVGHTLPLRYLTPRGRADEARYAATVTPAIVEGLQAYFGTPHPFEKLDSLVIPITDSFGAMENPGLITYASRFILGRPGEETAQLRRSYTSLAAHEIAHQWFGNQVTPAWWDDLWLNEAFASWLGDKVVTQLEPGWRWEVNTQRERAAAMRIDRLPSTRQVRQPIRVPQDMGTAFDPIVYAKGQLVLSMFEAWLGPERMQAGVRRYLARHAWGSATGADFLVALAEQDPALPAAFVSFIDQPGTPKLAMELLCDTAPPRLRVTQSRYEALGSQVPAAHWQVPLLLRTPAGLTRHLLTQARETIPLPDAACPAWLQPNAGGSGYYRSGLAPALLMAYLQQGEPGVNERLALLDDQLALTASGDLALADALPLIALLSRDPRSEVQAEAALALLRLADIVEPAQTPAYARLWQQSFGPLARELGWQPASGEPQDRRLLRELLLPLLAQHGEDAGLRAQALSLARHWLTAAAADGGMHSELLDPGLRGPVLRSAALAGDAALFDAMLALFRRSPERELRADLAEALGAFADPALAARARALLLDPGLDVRELLPVLSRQAAQPALWADALGFVEQNDTALRPRLSTQVQGSLPLRFSKACSAAQGERLQQVFGPHQGKTDGGPGNLAKAADAIRLCSAYRAAQGASLMTYLQAGKT